MPIYMKLEDAKGKMVVLGDVTTAAHAGWIELHSANLGSARQTSPSEIVVTKLQDSASVGLRQRSVTGGEPLKVTIDFVKDEDDQEAPYLSIILSETLISNYSVSGSGGGANDGPMETITLNFTKIEFSTKPTSTPDGTPDQIQWDLSAVGLGG
jgi:type VI secretion system secreted protein Hcp